MSRIDISSEYGILPFSLKRRQLPIKVAFAMTVNKPEGQSLYAVGIYSPQPVFSHGQLYVALSRSGNPNTTKILINNIPAT
jgi:hypothetical protein